MILRIIDGLVASIGINLSQRSFQFPISQLLSKYLILTIFYENIQSFNRAPNDTSNFSSYPESDTHSPALKPADDPFLDW